MIDVERLGGTRTVAQDCTESSSITEWIEVHTAVHQTDQVIEGRHLTWRCLAAWDTQGCRPDCDKTPELGYST